jgi:hypothetical protein
MDQRLVAIASRDPNFIPAANHYYEVLSQQARDTGLTISEVAHLNSLEANDQEVEIGKLNEARNKIIAQTQERNQAVIDAYNANVLREINAYGDNFEAIIRNINDQALLTGGTFLYATNRADLYRQLHMEMPELELVEPDPEPEIIMGDPNRTPTYQELTVMYPDVYQKIYQQRIALGEDPEDVNEFVESVLRINYKNYPRPLPPQIISNVQLGKGRKPGDTALFNYRYMLTDEQNQELEDMIANGTISRNEEEFYAQQIRERDRGLFRKNDQDKADEEGLSLDAYRKKYGIVAEPEPPTPPTPTPVTPRPPVNNSREPTYEELKIMYPDNYARIVSAQSRNGQIDDASIEEALRINYENYPRPLPQETAPTQPTQPNREPTYEELQVMYPNKYQQYTKSYANAANYNIDMPSPEEQAMMIEGLLRAEHTNRTQAGTAPPLPTPSAATTPTQPTPAPTTTPTTTTPSGAGPSDYRPRQQEPMQTAQTPEPTNP